MPVWSAFLGILLGLEEGEVEAAGLPGALRSTLIAYTAGIRRSLRPLHAFYALNGLYPNGLDS